MLSFSFTLLVKDTFNTAGVAAGPPASSDVQNSHPGCRSENPPQIHSSSRGNWLKISSTKPTRPMPAVYFHLSSSTSQTCQPLAETPTSCCQGPGPQGEPGAEGTAARLHAFWGGFGRAQPSVNSATGSIWLPAPANRLCIRSWI